MRVLIAGCGYVGLALGASLAAAGHNVFGIRRSPAAAPLLRESGIEPFLADFTAASQLRGLPRGWDWVVHCAAPAAGTVEAYRSVYLDGLRTLVQWLEESRPAKFVFTSSTSVYGQADGSWVTEESPTEPASPRAKVLVDAETFLLSQARFPGVVLRFAGIYGPGRNRLERLKRGEVPRPDENAGRRWLNLVHRDDVVTAIELAFERAKPGEVFNVTDGHPVTEGDLVTWLADSLGVDLPEAEAGARPSSPGWRRATSKRVNSSRIRLRLGWEPRYRDYREGYAPLLAAR